MQIKEIKPNPDNPRTIKDEAFKKLCESIKRDPEFMVIRPIVVDDNGVILGGNMRYRAIQHLGMKEVPDDWVVKASNLTEEQQRRFIIVDNAPTGMAGDWDIDMLANKWDIPELLELGFDLDSLSDLDIGNLADGLTGSRLGKSTLREKFVVPPLSVLDTRLGYWQDRKKAWKSLGIASETGRKENALYKSKETKDPKFYYKKAKTEKLLGREISAKDFKAKYYQGSSGAFASGTSIFDPVLCEIMYRWFTPPQGVVLDPFAGGSVRGIVASVLGRDYVGVDLRQEQVDANREQYESVREKEVSLFEQAPRVVGIRATAATKSESKKGDVVWHAGDSQNIDKICEGIQADFVFSCPPYYDLEVYSDDPRDLSNMNPDAFIKQYRDIIAKTCALLKNDRFAVFVVGEVRDSKGIYRRFVPETIQAFEDAGLRFYNDIVMVNAIGTVSMCVANKMVSSRKIGKVHQNVLVFVKGDPTKAAVACGPVEAMSDDECAALFGGNEEQDNPVDD